MSMFACACVSFFRIIRAPDQVKQSQAGLACMGVVFVVRVSVCVRVNVCECVRVCV